MPFVIYSEICSLILLSGILLLIFISCMSVLGTNDYFHVDSSSYSDPSLLHNVCIYYSICRPSTQTSSQKKNLKWKWLWQFSIPCHLDNHWRLCSLEAICLLLFNVIDFRNYLKTDTAVFFSSNFPPKSFFISLETIRHIALVEINTAKCQWYVCFEKTIELKSK